MEGNAANVVAVAIQSEQALLFRVVPQLDGHVIAARSEQGLCRIKRDTTDRSCAMR